MDVRPDQRRAHHASTTWHSTRAPGTHSRRSEKWLGPTFSRSFATLSRVGVS
jgi:hypothetical protein